MDESIDEIIRDLQDDELQPFEKGMLAGNLLQKADSFYDLTKVYLAITPRFKPDGTWDDKPENYENMLIKLVGQKWLSKAKTVNDFIGMYWLTFNDAYLFPKIKNRLIVRAEEYGELRTMYFWAQSIDDSEFVERIKKKIYRTASPVQIEDFKECEKLKEAS